MSVGRMGAARGVGTELAYFFVVRRGGDNERLDFSTSNLHLGQNFDVTYARSSRLFSIRDPKESIIRRTRERKSSRRVARSIVSEVGEVAPNLRVRI